jgi:hypothetical protein
MPKDSKIVALGAWRLYDMAKKMFFNNLTLGQVFKVLESIPPIELKYWHICKDDEPDWYPLSEKILEMKSQQNKRPDGVVSLGEFVDEMHETASGLTQKTLKTLSKTDKRKSSRYKEKIGVFIDVGDAILSGHTKDISLISIKFNERFPIKYVGRFYPVTLKIKPAITLRGTPLALEKEHVRGAWSIIKLDPNFNLAALAQYLGEEVLVPKK